jgi:2-phosphoglycerate kinase
MAKIVVTYPSNVDKTPFLKGILVRSLVNLGIAFDDAYDLSQSVRDELKHKTSISSSELQELVSSTIKKHFGSKVQKAYIGRHQKKSDIIVHTPSRSTAFSTGILSRSLEACAINPKLALIGANKVLATIRKSGHKEIDHKALRRLVYRCLREHCSKKSADKYLAWRRFQNSDIPLIIMIGGATGTGKSTIAAELAYRLDIARTQSTDMMREIIRSYLAEQVTPALQYSSFEAWRGLPASSYTINEEDPHKVINGFLAQLSAMQPAIETTINRTLQEHENLIMEGVHIVPSELELCNAEKEAVCMQFMLTTLDKKSLKKQLKKRIREQSKHRDSDHVEFIDEIWELQSWLLETADSEEVNIIPNLNIDDSIREILEIASQIILQRFPPDLNAMNNDD